ncbi:VOC family protein [Streptomyces althioticus]|uniref:VOC family protein n=1 Tax=Streptomyces althioticus TaxID=83380 RepID=UPI00367AC5D7
MAENRASEYSEYTEGTPCWVDAQLPDLEAGKRFYGELFGWAFEEQPTGTVRALKDRDPVASLAHKTDGRLPTVWTVSFSTPDADALCARIRAAGGRVIAPPAPFGDLGRTALVTDPEGAVFSLWQPGTATGFARRHEPGTFAWVQLYTRDTGTANTFYGDLFQDALFGEGADPEFGRAPVSEVFAPEMPPHLLVHFAVTELEPALERVARLGGRTQVPPFETSYGTAAVVTDNQGASFALLRR